jgi:hypothetical protein
MRECSFCGAECDSSIGIARELTTTYWGGHRNGNVERTPRLVSFFCTEDHRSQFLVLGEIGGEFQFRRPAVIE